MENKLKTLKPEVMAHFKAQGKKPRVRSTKWFLQVWFPLTEASRSNHCGPLAFADSFNASDRNRALDAVYGKDFKRNWENPSAGTVNNNSISLGMGEWQRFLADKSIN